MRLDPSPVALSSLWEPCGDYASLEASAPTANQPVHKERDEERVSQRVSLSVASTVTVEAELARLRFVCAFAVFFFFFFFKTHLGVGL